MNAECILLVNKLDMHVFICNCVFSLFFLCSDKEVNPI